MKDLIAIAKIARPRGIKGEVVANILTDFPERFEGLENVTATTPAGERVELTIENHWFQKDRIVLKFAGYDSIESVQSLRDAEIGIGEAEAVELETDEYFDWQLEECEVETIGGVRLGKVDSVMRTGGTEILVVKGVEKEYLIPFAEAICPEVDIENKIIRVDPPEGLLEF